MRLLPQSHQKPSPESKTHGTGRWFWPAALVVLIAGGASVLLVNRLSPEEVAVAAVIEEQPIRKQLHPLEVVTVERRRLEDVVKVTGTIEPLQEAVLSAQVDGIAETVSVHPGDVVEAGQLLVAVGTTDLRLQMEQQRSALASTMVQLRAAQVTLDRTRSLADKGLAAQSALEAAQTATENLAAALEAEQSALALAEANLERARILAPFAGTISARRVEPGQVISPGADLLTLVDTSTVRVELVAALSDATNIREGQTVRLTVAGMNAAAVTGTVDRVSPVAEAGTRSIKVYLTLGNPGRLLRGGMFVSGEIVVRSDDSVLAVPAASIRPRDGIAYVLLVENDRIVERRVETSEGWQSESLVGVRSGLVAGDVVVSTALSGLADGTPIALTGY